MPFYIVTGDITKMQTDAIVNAANKSLLGGGGVDGAIHRAAGAKLYYECKTLGGCETGKAKITNGYNLPAKHVIHTVGPVWSGGNKGERELLYSCYYNSLTLANENEIKSISFPLISSGVYGYPKEEAIAVAHEAIWDFLKEHDMTVYLVLFKRDEYRLTGEAKALQKDIDEYLKKGCITERDRLDMAAKRNKAAFSKGNQTSESMHPLDESCRADTNLTDMIKSLDMSFSQMLLKLIDESGMTDSQCYKAANIDRRLFSKIRNDASYHPTKQTCIAFAIALKLNIEGVQSLLRTAGYTLTHSSKFDVIIEYFVTHEIYDIFVINDTLFEYDEMLLGA